MIKRLINWFTLPRVSAAAFTVGAILLAVSPGIVELIAQHRPGKYDATLAVLTVTAIAVAWYAAFAYEAAVGTRRSAEAAETHANYVARQVRGKDVADLHRLRDLLEVARRRLADIDGSVFDLMRSGRVTRGKTLLNEELLDETRALAYTLGGSVGETALRAVINLEAAHQSYGDAYKATTKSDQTDLPKQVAGAELCVEVANEDVQRALAAVLQEIDVLGARIGTV